MDTVCPVCESPLEPQASACPACGFKLLGSTQRFKPVALDHQSSSPESPRHTSAALHVVRGPQTGGVFLLGDSELSIGRSPRCDIFLNDMTVSREHAAIKPQNDGYIICDTNSFNGLWVNDVAVEQHHLEHGDIVQIGSFSIIYKER